MIVGNFFHIKNTNGLFYYGLDYLRENLGLVRSILVRPELQAATREALPGCTVLACSAPRMLWEATRGALRGDILYTPTSHPLPLLSRQWIVVHDTYPFTSGSGGRLKEALLRCSLALSSCRVAYINESETLPFVAELGVAPGRRLFAPNRFPTPPGAASPSMRQPGDTLVVGLVGTDSAKKNYEALFAQVVRSGGCAALNFRVYGHRSAYFEALKRGFPAISLELVQSDHQSLEFFFSEVDLLTSVASQEGFGRPIAAALLSGWPCFLLSQPVFKEFFEPGAIFFDALPALVEALIDRAASGASTPARYTPPPRAVEGYEQAVALLKCLGSVSA